MMRRLPWITLALLLTAVAPARAEDEVDRLIAYILDALDARQTRCSDGQLAGHDGERVVCAVYTSSFSAFASDWELVMRHSGLPIKIHTDDTWTYRDAGYRRTYSLDADRDLRVRFAPGARAIVFDYKETDADPHAAGTTPKKSPLDLPGDDDEPAPRMAGFGGVSIPRLIEESRVEPLRSERARAERAAGRVTLEIVVGRDGAVRDVVVLKAEPEGYDFGKAATEAVLQWRFEPATFEDKPVPVVLNRTVEVKQDPSAAGED
jgi:TonB family protein